MLELFRRDQPIGYIFLFLYTILLRAPTFISETNWSPLASSAFSNLVYNMTGYTSVAAQVTGTVLIFIHAVLINMMVAENRITRENSLFPGLFYVLFSTLLPDFNYLSPALMANTFIILTLYNIFNSYKKSGNCSEVFNAGIFIGIAMLFDFSYAIFLICGFVGLLIVRSFRFVERIQFLLGFVIPIFLGGTYYFWMGHLDDFLQTFTTNISWLDWAGNINSQFFLKVGILIFLMLFVIFNYSNYGKKNNVHAMRKVDVMFWFLILPVTTFLFQTGIRLDHALIVAPPMGILLGFSVLNIQNKMIAEVVHLVLISISLLFQYILL
ncbi:MAG TPA: DUF6427 family protein [Saprospiraceae bacterium]|nr:MAG: beta-carotene 15,15-monooxygenase [Candidatus Parvibacillus calidus]MBX2937054.1 hypothetical protein [Saprospiraceae bacterium]MBK7739639.1 hypothetical protein [Candidatus Parvibacillus calidus]MBX7179176.1 hypothetical protein [Saprospiraceae bacterium]MCB0589651.1 hypothetical protein [Saprospiraceae bacterium]